MENQQEVSKAISILTGVSLAFFLATQMTEPVLPIYIAQMGPSTFELGLIMAILSFTGILTRIPLGILADQVGKWRVISFTLLGQSLSYLLYSMVSRYELLYPVRVIHGLAMAAFAPTAFALISDLTPAGKRGEKIGRFMTAMGVAALLGPFLFSLLIEYSNYVRLLQLAATIPLLALLAFLLAIRSIPRTVHPKRLHNDRIHAPISLTNIAFSRNVLVLSYIRLVSTFSDAFFITLFALYASKTLFLTSVLIGVLFVIKGSTNAMFRFPLGKLLERVGHKAPLVVSYLILCLVYLIISKSKNLSVLCLAMALYGFAHGVRVVTEWTLFEENTSPTTSGVRSAYFDTMTDIGGALGAVTSGALSIVLSTQSIFELTSLVVLSGALIAFLFIKEKSSALEGYSLQLCLTKACALRSSQKLLEILFGVPQLAFQEFERERSWGIAQVLLPNLSVDRKGSLN
jgi:MFS family permease